MPPNTLKAKLGGGSGATGLDMAAIKSAEAAVDTLKEEFTDWAASDVQRLVEARDVFAAVRSAQSCADLFRASLDIKAQGATFDYPLIARIGSSLCKLIEDSRVPEELPLPLIDAHVDAIRVIVREKLTAGGNKMAIMLAEELEARASEQLTASV